MAHKTYYPVIFTLMRLLPKIFLYIAIISCAVIAFDKSGKYYGHGFNPFYVPVTFFLLSIALHIMLGKRKSAE